MILDIVVPAVNKTFYPDHAVQQIKDKISEIRTNYGTIIQNVSKLTVVPSGIIESFIFIESAGKSSAISSANAIGLMQVTPDTATGCIFYEKKHNRLQEPEKNILQKYLGVDRLDCILKMKYFSQPLPCNNNNGRVVTKDDLLKPEFNILVGSILLGQLIDIHTTLGKVRMDKVVIQYNRGFFHKPIGNTIEETLNSEPTETKNYVYKLMGVNGLLSIV